MQALEALSLLYVFWLIFGDGRWISGLAAILAVGTVGCALYTCGALYAERMDTVAETGWLTVGLAVVSYIVWKLADKFEPEVI